MLPSSLEEPAKCDFGLSRWVCYGGVTKGNSTKLADPGAKANELV